MTVTPPDQPGSRSSRFQTVYTRRPRARSIQCCYNSGLCSNPRHQAVPPRIVTRPSARIVRFSVGPSSCSIAGGALNYVDRATLSVANKLIQDDLGIPVAKMGLLLSAFLWAYAFSQLPVGGLIDRFGPRRLLGLGLFSWSVAQAAGGLVTASESSSRRASRWVLAKRRCFRVERGWCGTGSAFASGGSPPVFCSLPRHLATSSQSRCSRSSCCV